MNELHKFALKIVEEEIANVNTMVEIAKLNNLHINRKLAFNNSIKVKEAVAEYSGSNKEISTILKNNSSDKKILSKLLRHELDKEINTKKLDPEKVFDKIFKSRKIKSKFEVKEILKLDNEKINIKLINNSIGNLTFIEIIKNIKDDNLKYIFDNEEIVKEEEMIHFFIRTRFRKLNIDQKQEIIDRIMYNYNNNRIIMRDHLFSIIKYNKSKENIDNILNKLISIDMSYYNQNISILYNISSSINNDILSEYLNKCNNDKNIYPRFVFNLLLDNEEDIKKDVNILTEMCKNENKRIDPDIYILTLLSSSNPDILKFIIEFSHQNIGYLYLNVYEFLVRPEQHYKDHYRNVINEDILKEVITKLSNNSKKFILRNISDSRCMEIIDYGFLYFTISVLDIEKSEIDDILWINEDNIFNRFFSYNDKFNLLNEERQVFMISKWKNNNDKDQIIKFLENVNNDEVIKLLKNKLVKNSFV